MTDATRDVAAGTNRARLITLALLSTLIALSVTAAFYGERSPVSFWLVVVFLVVPLAITLPGIVRRTRRTYAWATLCITPHFVYALTEVVANPAIRVLTAAMIAAALGLTLSLVAYLRLTRSTG